MMCLAVEALDSSKMLAGGIVRVNHRAARLVEEASNATAAVVDLQKLASGMRQAGELGAGPGGGDAVSVGILDKLHTTVGAETGDQAVRFTKDEGSAEET